MTATAPLTFGQASVFSVFRRLPPQYHPERNVTCGWELPPHITVTEVRDVLHMLVERHESLRTRFNVDDNGASQTVGPAGELPIEHRRADGAPDEASRVRSELRSRSFDLSRQNGWSGIVFLDAQGALRHLALCFHHAIVDAHAVDQLQRDFTALVGPDSRARESFLARPVLRPRELAVEQRSPRWRDRRRRSLQHWAQVVEEIGHRAPPPGRTSGRIDIGLRSPTLLRALQTAAARFRVSAQSVLLTLTAVAVAVIADTGTPVLGVTVGNRFDPRWRKIVAPMAQTMLLPVPVDPIGRELGDLARTVHLRALTGMRHGLFDPEELAARQAERGTPVPIVDHQFNHIPYQPGHGHAELPAEQLIRLDPWYTTGPRLRLWTFVGSDFVIHGHSDPRLVPEPALRAVLDWFREELTRAAAEPTVYVREMLDRLEL